MCIYIWKIRGKVSWISWDFSNLVTFIRLNTTLTSRVQTLNFPTPFQASQYFIFSPSESIIKAHRKILNVHFRHRKFLADVTFSEVRITHPKLKMLQISTLILWNCAPFHALERENGSSSPTEFLCFSNILLFMISSHFR